jgi:hypothetical protein
MDLSVDGEFVETFENGTHMHSWNTSAEQYGTHTITLTGYDNVTNSASITITVTVDNTPPTANIILPTNNAYVRGNLTIFFVVQDLNLKNASLMVSDALTFSVTGNSLTLDTMQFPDGNYTVKLVAYDLAENKAETSIMITLDNTLPDAHITQPATNSYVKGIINVTFTHNDTNLESATLQLDGEFLAEVTSTTYQLWNTTSLNDGIHTLTLTVLDMAGNTKTVEVTVTVDNTLPDVEILEPSDGDYKKGTVDVTFYAYDANVERISLHIEGGVLAATWNSSGTHTDADGAHTITILISDKAGNQLSVTSTIIVDNTRPTFEITSLGNGTTLSGTVTINYTATDASPPVTLILYIDDVPILINQPYPWDTTKVVDGNHTIRIVAADLVGNTKETAITVKTANAPPVYMAYIGYAAAGVLGLALGAVAVWLLLKKKPTPTP